MPEALTARDRLFVALDVERLDDADALLERLAGEVTGCKIGNQLFTAAGPLAVERALKHGFRVFLDLKYHDIPNTVAGAVREAARLGVFVLNVHASGGAAMLRAAAEAAARAAKDFAVPRPLVIGVTVLTSLDRRALETEVGVPGSVDAHVLRLAEQSRAAGLDGCVASPREIRRLRNALGRTWVIVTPGIRPAARDDDQMRTATPAAAVSAGADYLVVGRPVTAAPDPVAAARAIVEEIEASAR
ncbi:MAG TPA: orotidine-5'-phosphate decarboxylase [Candidatus Binatia bacterium]|nr:orotidine-5'-phosphate decarboxylase [Candidatus Binatia bacterium]